jgi:hypothetical protein
MRRQQQPQQQEESQQVQVQAPDGGAEEVATSSPAAAPASKVRSDLDVLLTFERAGCALGQLQMMQSIPLDTPAKDGSVHGHSAAQVARPYAASAQPTSAPAPSAVASSEAAPSPSEPVSLQAARLVTSALRAADAGTHVSLLAQLAEAAAAASATAEDDDGEEEEASSSAIKGGKEAAEGVVPWASTLSHAERLVDAAHAAMSGLQAVQLLRPADEQQHLQLLALEEHYGMGTTESASAGGATRLLNPSYQPICLRDASYAWRAIWSTGSRDAGTGVEAQQGKLQHGQEKVQVAAGSVAGGKEEAGGKVPGSWEEHSKSSTPAASASTGTPQPSSAGAPRMHPLAEAPRAHRQQVLLALARDVECKARRVVVEALAHVISAHMGSLTSLTQQEGGHQSAGGTQLSLVPATAETQKAVASLLVAAITLTSKLAAISKTCASIEQEASTIMQREQQAAAPGGQDQAPKQQQQQQHQRKGADTMSLKPKSAWMSGAKHGAVGATRRQTRAAAAPVLPEWHVTAGAQTSGLLQECVVLLVRQVRAGLAS